MTIRFVVLAGVSLLAGCATLPEPPGVVDPALTWQARRAALEPLTRWELTGRVAFRSAAEGGSATLSWRRQAGHHAIDLTGPLGSGHVRLTQDADGAELRDSDRNVLRDTSAEVLLARATGWQLPVNGLNYWVLGLPVPEAANDIELDRLGRTARLTQQGWRVEYLDYAQFDGRELPSRLFLKREHADGDDAGALEVRLVIERWTLMR